MRKNLCVSNGAGENLFGRVIPAGALFGCCAGVTYICTDTTVTYDGFYVVKRYSAKQGKWFDFRTDKSGPLHRLISEYVSINGHVHCDVPELRSRKRNKAFHERKKQEAQLIREASDVRHFCESECGRKNAPTEYTGRVWSQRCVDGPGYSNEWERNATHKWDEDYVGAETQTYATDHGLLNKPFGEMTYSSAGTAECDTGLVDSRLVQKNGLNVNFAKNAHVMYKHER